MSKRKKIKDRHESKNKSAQTRKVQAADDEKTDVMDFGGLPNRNLKKNLGCG